MIIYVLIDKNTNSRERELESNITIGDNKINKRMPWDESGYVMPALTMGRWGNQLEHLGVFAFAAATNRTLVLPSFISYTTPR